MALFERSNNGRGQVGHLITNVPVVTKIIIRVCVQVVDVSMADGAAYLGSMLFNLMAAGMWCVCRMLCSE